MTLCGKVGRSVSSWLPSVLLGARLCSVSGEPSKTTVYLSEYEFGVDDKRRLQVPAKWRPPDGGEGFEFFLLRWQPDREKPVCLLALPPAAFQKLTDKVSALPFSDPKAEVLRRSLTRASDVVTVDNAGRICLPKGLADAAGIQKRALLVGMLDRFQIWSPENYESVRVEDEANTPAALALI